MGLLPDTYNCELSMHRECRERFPPPPRFSDPDMHHGTCVTHVPWCMPGSLTNGFLWSERQGKHSRYSRRMRNPQIYVSGKRPMSGLVYREIPSLLQKHALFHGHFYHLSKPACEMPAYEFLSWQQHLLYYYQIICIHVMHSSIFF